MMAKFVLRRIILANKQSKDDKLRDFFSVYKAIKEGVPVKRHGAKDGSIPTHPVIDVPDVLEKEVVKACQKWLISRGIFHDRHETGAGDIAGKGYATYGIKYAGDIIGILPDGRHLEIECKRGKGGRLSRGQQERKEAVEETNGMYLIIHGAEELEYYLESVI